MFPAANSKTGTTASRTLLLVPWLCALLCACGQTGQLYQPEPERAAAQTAESSAQAEESSQPGAGQASGASDS